MPRKKAEPKVKQKIEVAKKITKPVLNPTSIESVCAFFGIEYREGVTRLLDVSRALGVEYHPDRTLEEYVSLADKKK